MSCEYLNLCAFFRVMISCRSFWRKTWGRQLVCVPARNNWIINVKLYCRSFSGYHSTREHKKSNRIICNHVSVVLNLTYTFEDKPLGKQNVQGPVAGPGSPVQLALWAKACTWTFAHQTSPWEQRPLCIMSDITVYPGQRVCWFAVLQGALDDLLCQRYLHSARGADFYESLNRRELMRVFPLVYGQGAFTSVCPENMWAMCVFHCVCHCISQWVCMCVCISVCASVTVCACVCLLGIWMYMYVCIHLLTHSRHTASTVASVNAIRHFPICWCRVPWTG